MLDLLCACFVFKFYFTRKSFISQAANSCLQVSVFHMEQDFLSLEADAQHFTRES